MAGDKDGYQPTTWMKPSERCSHFRLATKRFILRIEMVIIRLNAM